MAEPKAGRVVSRRLALVGALAVGLPLALIATAPSGAAERRVAPPPASLAQYYPPESRRRVYTREMLELGRLLGTLSVDAARSSEHTARSLEAFRKQWTKVSAMVPEWRSYFPRLDFDGATAAPKLKTMVEQAKRSCTDCHVQEMFRVQAVYHWPEFSEVSTQDDDGLSISFHATMVELSNRMAAIPETVQRSDWDHARDHAASLRREFARLEQSCESCHEEAREYFVDKSVKGKVLKINGLVRSKKGTPEVLQDLMDGIYNASCIPCHQLHMPAAFLQMQMSRRPRAPRGGR